jgi:cyclic pyranopterin phosphate synthase
VKLYRFDGIDSSLKLVPLAARRALDALGAKLSLEGFQSLTIEAKEALTEAGSLAVVDLQKARAALTGASPPPEPLTPEGDLSDRSPPDSVRARLGAARPLSDKMWQSISPLDRYALSKVTGRHNEERIQGAYDEIVGQSAVSTHVRPAGGVHMVSISEKTVSRRRAKAECWVKMSPDAFERLMRAEAPKGDVLGTARLAGLMAAKRTADLIPLCHPLALEHAEIDFEEYPEEKRLRILCSVTVEARTGVEMEAMVGANLAALTVYDMLKSIDRKMELGPTRLLEKSGGRSGTFTQESEA